MRRVSAIIFVVVLASCGGKGKAVPTEVEIDWPDAAVLGTPAEVPPDSAEPVPQVPADAGPSSSDAGL